MGYFGNRSSGGIKQYASGTAWVRTIDGNTNLPSGSTSAWTQIGYFKNSKISLENASSTDFRDYGNNIVATVMTNPQKGEITLDLMERDDSVRQLFTTTQGLYYQFALKGATLTYSGTKSEVWVAPYTQIEQGFEYTPGASEPTYPLKFICTGAKADVSVVLPGTLSGTTASISSGAIYWTQDV